MCKTHESRSRPARRTRASHVFGAALLAALLAFPLLAADARADGIPNPLRVATEGAYPPFNATDSNGELIGFDVEIAEAICKKLKVRCQIVGQDWDGIIPGLVAKKYDAIIASMSITEERKKVVDFTERYYSNYLRFVAPAGTVVNDLSDLDGRVMGAQRATVAAEWAETNSRGGEVRLYDTQTAAYADLQSGRIELLVSDVYPAYDWLETVEGYEFVGPRVDIDDSIGVAVRKGELELRNAITDAIAEMRRDGTYKRINRNYFPFDIY